MPSKTTVTIANTINWCAAYVVQRPTSGVASIPGEPAITISNVLMGIILGAPMKWEWNRIFASAAITTKIGISDYAVVLNDFGYLEKAVLNSGVNTFNSSAVPPSEVNWELEIYKNLGKEGKPNRPGKIATLLDDDNGNITFRLFPAPDQIYTVDLLYQKAPIMIAQGSNLTTTTWAPIPDKMQYLYQQGFRAQMQGMYNVQLYLNGMQIFYKQLVAACEGLTEAEKNIYLEDYLRTLVTQQEITLGVQQGKASRS